MVSQVIQISSTCYPDIVCSDSTITTSQQDLGRCAGANGNFPESIVIVSIQNTSGCSTVTPPTTDTGIETTSPPTIGVTMSVSPLHPGVTTTLEDAEVNGTIVTVLMEGMSASSLVIPALCMYVCICRWRRHRCYTDSNDSGDNCHCIWIFWSPHSSCGALAEEEAK